ncbi:MAG: amino acid ABC transporter permease [Alphaproteobacteria bacterium]|nr:amino acid ABC transporter permease [Alphaproteobacteria bacterium]
MFDSSTLYIIQGAAVTLKYTFLAVFFGALIGTLIAICRISKVKFWQYFSTVYISIFRGTPLLIQLSMVYFILPMYGIKITVFVAGVIAFSLNSAAYIAEIIRSGINSVDKGQLEAANSLSIPYYYTMRDIILPQAFRNILPALVNEIVNLLKETAIISVIGGADLMRRAQIVSSETYDYFTPLVTAAISYYVLVAIFSSLAKILENKLKIQ